jgi:hypothetical protein
MNWKAVADSLFDQAEEATKNVEALRTRMSTTGPLANDPLNVERVKLVERHRINANLCYALAAALDAGLGITR